MTSSKAKEAAAVTSIPVSEASKASARVVESMLEEYLQTSSNGFGSSARKSLNVSGRVYKDTVAS